MQLATLLPAAVQQRSVTVAPPPSRLPFALPGRLFAALVALVALCLGSSSLDIRSVAWFFRVFCLPRPYPPCQRYFVKLRACRSLRCTLCSTSAMGAEVLGGWSQSSVAGSLPAAQEQALGSWLTFVPLALSWPKLPAGKSCNEKENTIMRVVPGHGGCTRGEKQATLKHRLGTVGVSVLWMLCRLLEHRGRGSHMSAEFGFFWSGEECLLLKNFHL